MPTDTQLINMWKADHFLLSDIPLNKKMKPILFSTPMVQAILEGRKTQTRRIIKPQPNGEFCRYDLYIQSQALWTSGDVRRARYEKLDTLWVRETWHPKRHNMPTGWKYEYRATAKEDGNPTGEPWKPSIFMPREAARIFLEVTNVRVERLHDLDDNDAINEGIGAVKSGYEYHDIYQDYLNDKNSLNPVPSYKSLWEKINGKGSWDLNPWVWVYEFKVL